MAESQPSDEDTAVSAEKNVEHRTVREALEALPQAQRRTIELAYFGGYTHAELSELMGVPLGAVKGRMRIGLQKMRRALERTRWPTTFKTSSRRTRPARSIATPRSGARGTAPLARPPVKTRRRL